MFNRLKLNGAGPDNPTPEKPTNRILFRDAEFTTAQAVIQEGTTVTGGEYVASGGAVVYGQVQSNKLLTTSDQSVIIVAASGAVDGGMIDAHDLLIEGKATGVQITVVGRVEIGPSAEVSGTLLQGPMAEVYIAPSANVSALTVRGMIQRAATTMPTTLRSGTND